MFGLGQPRWMIIGCSQPPYDEINKAASLAWHTKYINAESNRYRTKYQALEAIASVHDRDWGGFVHFRIVKVKDFYGGWRW